MAHLLCQKLLYSTSDYHCYTILLSPIGQNLVTGPHSASKETEKCSFYSEQLAMWLTKRSITMREEQSIYTGVQTAVSPTEGSNVTTNILTESIFWHQVVPSGSQHLAPQRHLTSYLKLGRHELWYFDEWGVGTTYWQQWLFTSDHHALSIVPGCGSLDLLIILWTT